MFRPELHILILAAGASRRMRGRDKLLEPVGGVALLRKQALAALETGLPVRVALPPDAPARETALEGLAVRKIRVATAAKGLGESLRTGVAAIPRTASILVLLADLPEIDRADLMRMAGAQAEDPDSILRASSADGAPGHPVVFPPWARTGLMRISGDEGAREVLRAHAGRLRLIALPAQHATTDLDTPEDWARWRARQGT